MEVKHHLTVDDARAEFLKQFDVAVKGRKWLAVVWSIEDGKIVLNNKTTCDWPKGDYLEAISQLAHLCFEDVKGLPRDPLPLAPDFLFRRGNAEPEKKQGNGE